MFAQFSEQTDEMCWFFHMGLTKSEAAKSFLGNNKSSTEFIKVCSNQQVGETIFTLCCCNVNTLLPYSLNDLCIKEILLLASTTYHSHVCIACLK